ncbi:OmpA family protein [Thaumasiovibrio sp. DFM-14]|uniref:OmpA family protein n=1 Tax=Thaumasiovibrio sp. DFM-14 TaxID=3384792 RepID=UPI0039A1E90B
MNRTDNGVYLMRAPTNHLGEFIQGQLTPLADYTLIYVDGDQHGEQALPQRAEQGTLPDDNSAIQSRSEIQLAYTNANGKLHHISQQAAAASSEGSSEEGAAGEDNAKENSASPSNAVPSWRGSEILASHGATAEGYYFPAPLIPFSMATDPDNWVTNLQQLVGKYVDIPDNKFDINVEQVALSSLLDPRPIQDGSSDYWDDYKAGYQEWLQEGVKFLNVVKMPFSSAIVLNFSSVVFEGAKVTVSGVPAGVTLMGVSYRADVPAQENLAEVVEDTFKGLAKTDEGYQDDEQATAYTAAFYLDSVLPEQLSPKAQYLRFTVELDEDNYDASNFIEEHKIKTYSFVEQALHFPIVNALGRFSLINGDPISAEEVLLSSHPSLFKNQINKVLKRQTPSLQFVANQKAVQDSNEAAQGEQYKTVQAQLLHPILMEDAYYKLGMAVCTKGVGRATLAAVASAALSKYPAREEGNVTALAMGALGLYNNVSLVVGDIEKVLNRGLSLEKGVASVVKGAMSVTRRGIEAVSSEVVDNLTHQVRRITGDLNGTAISGRARSFVSRVGRFNQLTQWVDKMAEPYISAAECLYHFASFAKAANSAAQVNEDLGRFASDYYHNVQVQGYDLDATSEKNDLITGARNRLIASLPQTIRELSQSIQEANDNRLLVPVLFDAGSAQINEEAQAYLAELIEVLNQTGPMPIYITGHACDLGDNFDNDGLATHRAESVKKYLVARLADADWDASILDLGYGVANYNNADATPDQTRRQSRRADIYLSNTTYLQIPACRSGTAIFQEMFGNLQALKVRQVESTVAGARSLLCLLGVKFPLAAVAYALWSVGDVVVTGSELIEREFDPQNYADKKAIKALSERNFAAFSIYLDNENRTLESLFIKKAYIKRSIALIGLIRLILRSKIKETLSIQVMDMTDMDDTVNWVTKNVVLEYDLKGYIDYFILNDDWEIHNDSITPHLDEVWLENRNRANVQGVFRVESVRQRQLNPFIYGALTITHQLAMQDETRQHLEKGSHFKQCFPVHYSLASSDESLFDSLLVDNSPHFLAQHDNTPIFEQVVMSARPRGAKEATAWKPFITYLQDDRAQVLSPYDQIRILVVVNKHRPEIAQCLEQEDSLTFPLAARAVRHSHFGKDRKSAPTVDYVYKLKLEDLLPHEKEALSAHFGEDGSESVFGAIINPSYTLGKSTLLGTRPMSDLDNGLLRTFGCNDTRNALSRWLYDIEPRHIMKYHYEVYPLAAAHHAKRVFYEEVVHPARFPQSSPSSLLAGMSQEYRSYLCNFEMSLDPNRVYYYRHNHRHSHDRSHPHAHDGNHSHSHQHRYQSDDHVFIEKGFLEGTDATDYEMPKYVTNPSCYMLFKQPDVDLNEFSYPRLTPERPYQPTTIAGWQESIMSPHSHNTEYLAYTGVDWDKPLSCMVVVTSEHEPHRFPAIEAQQFDPTAFKVEVALSRRYDGVNSVLGNTRSKEISRLNQLVCIGIIEKKADSYTFTRSGHLSFKWREIVKSFSEQPQDVLRRMAKETAKTDVFVGVGEIEYLNRCGKMVQGLPPMGTAVWTEQDNRQGVLANYSHPQLDARAKSHYIDIKFSLKSGAGSGLEKEQAFKVCFNPHVSTRPANAWTEYEDDQRERLDKLNAVGEALNSQLEDLNSWLEAQAKGPESANSTIKEWLDAQLG